MNKEYYKPVLKLFDLGGPQKARGSIIGNINDIDFGIAILNATITDNKSGGRIIKATVTNIPRNLGQFTVIETLIQDYQIFWF